MYYPRNNNVTVAKGALYLLKCLAWRGSLPLYRQCILRSGIAEEVQVSNNFSKHIRKGTPLKGKNIQPK